MQAGRFVDRRSHLAYQATAEFIPKSEVRARFLSHSPAQANRCLTQDDWSGWAQVLKLESKNPACRAGDACILLVWTPAVLRTAFKTSTFAELDTLACVLRNHAPGCDVLSTPQLHAWVQGIPT